MIAQSIFRAFDSASSLRQNDPHDYYSAASPDFEITTICIFLQCVGYAPTSVTVLESTSKPRQTHGPVPANKDNMSLHATQSLLLHSAACIDDGVVYYGEFDTPSTPRKLPLLAKFSNLRRQGRREDEIRISPQGEPKMSTTQLTSTVVSALDDQNVIVSLKAPVERRSLAVALSVHTIVQGQVVVCVSDDPTWTDEVQFVIQESGGTWTRKTKRTFMRMSIYQFRHRSRTGLVPWQDKYRLSDIGIIIVPNFDLLDRPQRAMVEDALVSLSIYATSCEEDGDDLPPITVPPMMITVTPLYNVTAVARLVNAEIIEPNPVQNASRKPLALVLDDHSLFDTHVLAMLTHFSWQPGIYERIMVSKFGGVPAFATAHDIELHRTQLIARGFLEQTPVEGVYRVTKLGRFAAENGLNPGVAYYLVAQAVAAMASPSDAYSLY